MAKLKPGDRVDCRVKNAIIVSPYKNYDEIKTFQIIAVDAYGYYLYVPEYYALKNTLRISSRLSKELNIDLKFLNEQFVYISSDLVAQIRSIFDSVMCAHCKEFFPMAEPNQEDGTLICYNCRLDPYR
jgi:hypothetical protein